MIAVLKHNTTAQQRDHLISWLQSQGLEVHISEGEEYTVLGLVGDTSHIDPDLLESLSIVQSVRKVSEPYKKVNRKFHPADSVIEVGGGVKIGGGNFCMIAGPCSVENREQIIEVAKGVKAGGADVLRGGAFKPRTSPYAFQGLKDEGIRLLLKAKEATGLPIITEIMNTRALDLFADVDIIQVGARNMQNFDLLQELNNFDFRVILKRGFGNTVYETCKAREYIKSDKVILCERGIRTFSDASRFTLDFAAIPMLQKLTGCVVIVDPSHAAGQADLVLPLAQAALAAGADGLMIEITSNKNYQRKCDHNQAITAEELGKLLI